MRAMGSGSKSALARILLGGAEAALDVDKADLAEKKIAEAKGILGNSVDPESWHLGVCDAVAAYVDWQGGKDRSRARADLERAVAHMQAALGAEHPRVVQWQARLLRLDGAVAGVAAAQAQGT